MNTANLQLEGLYLAMAAILKTLRDKGVLSEAEIDQALDEAEHGIANDPNRTEALSAANRDATCFPIRFLRITNGIKDGSHPSFTEIARYIGVTKPAQDDTASFER